MQLTRHQRQQQQNRAARTNSGGERVLTLLLFLPVAVEGVSVKMAINLE